MTDDSMPERWSDDTQPTAPLTRTQAAQLLGVSVATVRRMEGTKLHPTVDQLGRHVFARAEVVELAQGRARTVAKRRTDGRIAAKVFTMFEDGAELPEIVIALEVEPRVVRELYAEWRVALEAGHVAGVRARRERAAVRADAETRREKDAWERTMAELRRAEVTQMNADSGLARRMSLPGRPRR